MLDKAVDATFERAVDSCVPWSVEVGSPVVKLSPSSQPFRTIAHLLVIAAVFEGAGILFEMAANAAGGPPEMRQHSRSFCRIVGAIVVFMFFAGGMFAHSRGPALSYDRDRGLLTVRGAAPITTDPRRATILHWTVGRTVPDESCGEGTFGRIEIMAYHDSATDQYLLIVATNGLAKTWQKLGPTLASALESEYRHREIEVPLRKS